MALKERDFIRQNKEKWQEFESMVKKKSMNPSRLFRLFVQVTDDLSHAKSHYNNRSVRAYLNGIGAFLFQTITAERGQWKHKFVRFWTHDLPLVVYRSRKDFMWSFLIFLSAVTIGVVSSMNDPEFARHVLGDRYVDMTLENIAKGDPMAVYKKEREESMFLYISHNNLRVDFYTFLLGLFGGIGTIFILLKNGVMLGTFQYFFVERDLSRESFLTIWQHGTLEIGTIIIAGAAGLALGRSMLITRTFSWMQSFKMGAIRGGKILCGIVPITLMAGFIEGFITRHTELPDIARLSVIIVSLIFLIIYFIWLPFKRAKELGFQIPEVLPEVPYEERSIHSEYVSGSGELFGRSFLLIKRYIRPLVGIMLVGCASSAIANGLRHFLQKAEGDMWHLHLDGIGAMYNYDWRPEQFFIHVGTWAWLTTFLLRKSSPLWKSSTKPRNGILLFLLSFIGFGLIHGAFYLIWSNLNDGSLAIMTVVAIVGGVFLLPRLLLTLANVAYGNESIASSLWKYGVLTKGSKGLLFQAYMLSIALVFLPLLILISLFNGVGLGYIREFIMIFLPEDTQWVSSVSYGINAFIFEVPYYFCFASILAVAVIAHHQLKELQEGHFLRRKIEALSK